jgi:hypothetical protein
MPFCVSLFVPSCLPPASGMSAGRYIPSKIRTAVGKSLTLRAAFNAAVRTDGEGTRSYAKALLRLRCRPSYDNQQSAGTR